jgi:uncharacterized protein DUF1573
MRLHWLGLGVLALALCSLAPTARAAGSPKAFAPVQSYDFGAVKKGEKVSHCFRLENRGSAPLKLDQMQLTLPDMTARVPASIPAGKGAQVCVEFGTSTLSLKVRAQALLFTNDPAQPRIPLLITGVVKAPIDFIPMGAVFAAVWKGEGGQGTVTIVNNQPKPLQVRGLNVEGQDFKARLETQKAGEVYKLVVTVPPDLAPGYYAGTAYVNTDSAGYARIGIPINILVKNEIYTFPLAINFRSVSLAQIDSNPTAASDLEQWVLVKKRAGKFSIKSISSDVPALKITHTPEGESNTFRVDVALSKGHLQPGSLDGKIRVLTDDSAVPELIVPVSGEIR